MDNQVLQPSLFDNSGVAGLLSAVNIPPVKAPELVTPAPTKLPSGWYFTEKYGEVFINNGVGWVVQRIGDKLESVSVKLSPDDITQKPSSERTKHAAAERVRYNLAKQVRKPSSFTPQAADTANDGALEV